MPQNLGIRHQVGNYPIQNLRRKPNTSSKNKRILNGSLKAKTIESNPVYRHKKAIQTADFRLT